MLYKPFTPQQLLAELCTRFPEATACRYAPRGIVLGRRDWVERVRRNPLSRALRVDKLTLAALDWTLRCLLEGDAVEEIPVLQMVLRDPEELRGRAERLATALRAQGWVKVSVEQVPSRVGGEPFRTSSFRASPSVWSRKAPWMPSHVGSARPID